MGLTETAFCDKACIAVMISDSADRLQAISALAPFARVRLCQSAQDLQASIANDGLTGVRN